MSILQRVARWIPRRLRYFVIINEAAKFSTENPTQLVPAITWDQMAKALE